MIISLDSWPRNRSLLDIANTFGNLGYRLQWSTERRCVIAVAVRGGR